MDQAACLDVVGKSTQLFLVELRKECSDGVDFDSGILMREGLWLGPWVRAGCEAGKCSGWCAHFGEETLHFAMGL